jgi:NADH-quinone oxidoreductase subunit M
MLIAFVYLYQQAGSFLLEDLYKLNPQQNNCGYS